MMRLPFMRGATLVLAASLALAGCKREPLEADPAIWHVTGSRGEEAWLFGTIHAAPRPLDWRTEAIDEALTRAGVVVVELANVGDDAAVAQVFASLSRSKGLPAVSSRVPPERQEALRGLMKERGIKERDLRDVETWAIALMLARPADSNEGRNGIDRAVIAAAGNKPIVELEGATTQLSIFDSLPESEQRELLSAVLSDAEVVSGEDEHLLESWRQGDVARIEAETRTGLLADPELRDALFTDRNLRWAGRIVAEMNKGQPPFVAVGAAHMVGPDGLIALLQQAGYTVTRLP
ncbi:TraB/GumN family protein [Novosphingobium sp. M1R2S20]|uniref:TraB/GumN family protein n=1 Tax=Novosphingobium rhizovicinum TaxID=3228928 RepID=A0ABV3RFF6_9SPHN